MKQLLLAFSLLFMTLSFGQKEMVVDAFETFSSNVGAKMRIMKSPEYRLTFSGETEMVDRISWELADNTLHIWSTTPNMDFRTVEVTVYTPSITAVALTYGGILTMDGAFSQIENFEISAIEGATADLSNIDFKNLVAKALHGGEILYKSTRTLISSTDEEGVIKRSDGIN
ncbi:DUF2807 domain-containing protein [Flavobacteriaceae bacterium 3-367]